jgi:hypothetical protein
MITLFFIASAWAIEPVIEPVEAGQINWTTMELEVTSRSDRTIGAWKDVRIQEQDALERLKPLMEETARRVRYDPERQAGDLLISDESGPSPKVARRLTDGLTSWRVRETRYLSNGGVEMDAVLELQRWLRPMFLDAVQPAVVYDSNNGTTGVLVDARHLSFQPCMAPEVHTDGGALLIHPGAVRSEVLRMRSPVAYVRDPADPLAIQRAGQHPFFVTAVASKQGCVLTLSPADSQLLSANPGFAKVVAAAQVVLVVSP